MKHPYAIRGSILAATLALMAPAALAAMTPAEGTQIAQARRPSPSPTVRPTPTPLPTPRPTATPSPMETPMLEDDALDQDAEDTEPARVTAEDEERGIGLTLGAEYILGTAGTTGFAPNGAGVPTQFNAPNAGLNAWSAKAEVLFGAFDLGAAYTNYMGVAALTAPNPNTAGAPLPFYWPQETWTAYGRLGAVRLGYLNEFFGRGIGANGAIGSVVLGFDSGIPLMPDMLDLDWSVTGGWGVIGEGPGHIPASARAGLSLKLAPLEVTLGYLGQATFTGDPATFFTAMTNPAQLGAGAAGTVNQTRLGTFQGPFLGANVTF
jgi:hypothetical protein